MIPYNGDARTFVTFRGVAPAGLRTATGGSFARSGLPTAVPASSYDGANQQLTFGAVTQTFDANGNLLTQTDATGTTTYTWDARNRLTALTGPTVSATFAYDALGRRTTKTLNGQSTSVLYDGLDIVKEEGGTGDVSYLRTLGIDEALSRTDVTGTLVYLPDALGSTLALADSGGGLPTTYTYAPFGETAVSGLPSSSPFQFTGRENDGTGLYYYRARYYDPIRSRFVSEDPIGLMGGFNLHAYVGNSPTNRIDPFGLKPSCVCGGFSGCAAIGIGGCMGSALCRCTDDCGNTEVKTVNYVCSCIGLGASVGGSVGGDSTIPVTGTTQGWIVGGSFPGYPGYTYSKPTPGLHNITAGPPGAFVGHCSCAIDVVQ